MGSKNVRAACGSGEEDFEHVEVPKLHLRDDGGGGVDGGSGEGGAEEEAGEGG